MPSTAPHRQPHSIRFHDHEWSVLEERARECGMTPSRYLRELALSYRPKAAPGAANRDAIHQLARIGSNLNQLTKRANQGTPIPQQEIFDCLEEINTATRALF